MRNRSVPSSTRGEGSGYLEWMKFRGEPELELTLRGIPQAEPVVVLPSGSYSDHAASGRERATPRLNSPGHRLIQSSGSVSINVVVDPHVRWRRYPAQSPSVARGPGSKS